MHAPQQPQSKESAHPDHSELRWSHEQIKKKKKSYNCAPCKKTHKKKRHTQFIAASLTINYRCLDVLHTILVQDT